MSTLSEFNSKKTHCKNGHELTPDNIKKLNDPKTAHYRVCLICHRSNNAKIREENRKPRITPLQRFMRNINKTESCWIWLKSKAGGKNNDYGVFRVGPEQIYAHRFSYEQFKGPIPIGKQIDHLCRNRSCVNPDHLEYVTQRENLMRGETKPAQNIKKTHCKRGHEFTPDNIYAQKPGHRSCRTCRNNRSIQNYYQKK